MDQVLFRDVRLLDPRWEEPRDGYEVLVEGPRIKEVSPTPIKAQDARVIEGGCGATYPKGPED